MTQEAIQKQIEIIKMANSDARKSKESARQFLMDAGIIKQPPTNVILPVEKKVNGISSSSSSNRLS